MMFNQRKKEAASPEVDTQAEAARITRKKLHDYEAVVHKISGVVFHRSEGAPVLEGSVEDHFNKWRIRRYDKFNRLTLAGPTKPFPIKTGRFEDGAAVFFMTQSGLSDQVHKLLLPREHLQANLEYRRASVNIDSQSFGQPDLRLKGLEQVMDADLLPSLQYCLGSLTVEASYDWQHSLKQTDFTK